MRLKWAFKIFRAQPSGEAPKALRRPLSGREAQIGFARLIS